MMCFVRKASRISRSSGASRRAWSGGMPVGAYFLCRLPALSVTRIWISLTRVFFRVCVGSISVSSATREFLRRMGGAPGVGSSMRPCWAVRQAVVECRRWYTICLFLVA